MFAVEVEPPFDLFTTYPRKQLSLGDTQTLQSSEVVTGTVVMTGTVVNVEVNTDDSAHFDPLILFLSQ